MEEERFITEYNKLINRIKKAEKFLESDTYIGKDKKVILALHQSCPQM